MPHIFLHRQIGKDNNVYVWGTTVISRQHKPRDPQTTFQRHIWLMNNPRQIGKDSNVYVWWNTVTSKQHKPRGPQTTFQRHIWLVNNPRWIWEMALREKAQGLLPWRTHFCPLALLFIICDYVSQTIMTGDLLGLWISGRFSRACPHCFQDDIHERNMLWCVSIILETMRTCPWKSARDSEPKEPTSHNCSHGGRVSGI